MLTRLSKQLLRVTLLVACAITLQTGVHAQEPQDPRARWEQLAPEERQRLRERFDALQRMSPDERRAVAERFERVRDLERGARERLSKEDAPELSGLDEHARHRALRGMVERDLSERGRAMRELLPPHLREKLEQAAPREREQLLEQFREQVRRDRFEHVLRDLGRRLDLPRAEIERMRVLPEVERETALFGLERRAIEGEIESRGLPPWLEAAEWEAWRTLDATQFIERWHTRARQVGHKRFEHPGQRPREPGEDPRGRDKRGPPRRLEPARAHEAFEQLRPDPRWFSELSELDPTTRRTTIENRMRQRALDFLERSPDLIEPRELEQLKQLQGHDFMRRLGDHLRDFAPPQPPGEAPHGPRPHELIPGPKSPAR